MINYFNFNSEDYVEKENYIFISDYFYQSLELIYNFDLDDKSKVEMEEISNDLYKNKEKLSIKDLKEILERNEYLNEIINMTSDKIISF